ncbi:MAG: alanine racemase, partial [Caldilineaceae bacterium SB0665_bin_25]|nr:alanine racemase [Caldilineaceae bacterium SB0665_bin_25]
DDEVGWLGEQQGAAISAEDAAARLKTINYEVASRLMARLPRVAI